MDEIRVLRDLLEAYSPSGEESRAVATFVRTAEVLGFSTRTDEVGNGIARRGSGRPHVVFLGHIDTVPGEIPVVVEDGGIRGRGAVDAKGAIAAALLAAASHQGSGEITVIAAVGEELDSRGARHLVPRIRPDFLILGEPSGWSGVVVGYRGNVSLELTFRGKRSHLSSPEKTTVERAMDVLPTFREFSDRHQGPGPFSSVSCKVHSITTQIHGGDETVRVGLNVRLPPGVHSDEVLSLLSGVTLEGYRITDRGEAVEVDSRNLVVRTLCAEIRALDGAPTIKRKAGTSDMNVVAPIWGCPAAAYGPGDGHLSHTDGEVLELEDLTRSVRVLRSTFAQLTRAPHRPVDPP